MRPGPDDALVVALDRPAFSELMQDMSSTFGLQMTGRAEVRRGTVDSIRRVGTLLRYLLDGRPLYEPGLVDFMTVTVHPRPAPVVPPEDPPGEIGHFLAEAGFLHLEGVFTEDEMAAVSADLDDAMASAEREDGASWWARTEGGEWYPSDPGFQPEVKGARELLRTRGSRRSEPSPTIATCSVTPRSATRLRACEEGGRGGRHLRRELAQGLRHGGTQPALLRPHRRDLGHGRRRENGELGVVAGSHRANISPLGVHISTSHGFRCRRAPAM